MALVNLFINADVGGTGSRMHPLNFSDWIFALLTPDGTIDLRSSNVNGGRFGEYPRIEVNGADLSITPNVFSNDYVPIITGPAIGTRIASGTIESFEYYGGYFTRIDNHYRITGISIQFQDLINNSNDPLPFLLAGNDEIRGTIFSDNMVGFAGNDVFLPADAYRETDIDTIDGGDGFDTVSYFDINRFVGINGFDDTKTDLNISLETGMASGSANGRLAQGRVSARLTSIENVIGSTGNDIITGNATANELYGGAGNDTLSGLDGNDRLFGEDGNDRLIGGTGDDALSGGAGDDVLLPGVRDLQGNGQYSQKVDGGFGIDTISFEDLTVAVWVNLMAGYAKIRNISLSAPKLVESITNVENIIGGAGEDSLTGDAFANSIAGGAGRDTIFGHGGNDYLSGGADRDRIDGGDGNDICFGGADKDSVHGDAGNDTIYGEDGDDSITGGDGNDRLFGGNGNDNLLGGKGSDIIRGGAGTDTAGYFGSDVGVAVNLANGTAAGGEAQGDQLFSIESLNGSLHDDILIGNSIENTLFGSWGNDQLFGLDGNDQLIDDTGDDSLHGGNGDDTLRSRGGNDGLFGDAGNDILYGGDHHDYLSGGDGDDLIYGESGNDQIDAGAGNDVVTLDSGNDSYTLGAGDDRVVFSFLGIGQDTIFDFGNGNDVIDFSATNITLSDLQHSAVETVAGVLFQDGSNSILLSGLTLAQIDWHNDFVFAA